MKKGSIKKIGLIGIMSALLCFSITAMAEGKATVVETNSTDENVVIYTKGDEIDNAVVQIGNTEITDFENSAISSLDVDVNTIILLDNSLSIKKDDRAKIIELIKALIDAMPSNEKMMFLTFNEEVVTLSDYSSDKEALKNIADEISFQNQDAFLVDALYTILTSSEYITAGGFSRIIVFSDGVDDKPIGYTKEELNEIAKLKSTVIHTFGCYDAKKKNSENIETMFAISRFASGTQILLDDVQDNDAVATINDDFSITRFVITPPSDMCDGSRKTIKIHNDSVSVTVECSMPQPDLESYDFGEEEEEDDEEWGPSIPMFVMPQEPEKPEPIDIPEQKTGFNPLFLLLLIPVVIIIAIIVVLVLSKKKKSKTTVITDYIGGSDDGVTSLLPTVNMTLVLRSVSNPKMVFEASLIKNVVVGRNADNDIVIDFEPSVSRHHCEFSVYNNHVFISDMDSANGTYRNDVPVTEKTEVLSGDTIVLGRLELQIEIKQG